MNAPGDASGSARLLSLPALFLCVFGVSVMMLTRMVPGPLKELDYMVISTVSVMIGLLAVFLVVIKTAKSGDLFFKQPGDRPRRARRKGTSILDLGMPLDQETGKES
jgi:hypothetical protein